MSNSIVFGNFTVTAGEIVKSPKAQYAVYQTTLHMEDDTSGIPALIRVFAPVGYDTLQDDTTVFLYGKVIASTKGPFQIESLNMFPYPGRPDDATHGLVPPFTPRLSILGHVSGPLEVTYEGHQEFKLMSSAWVRDKIQATSFMGRFDNTPRWKKVPNLKDGTAICIMGPVVTRHGTTDIALIRIEDVVFNPGSRPEGLSIPGDKSGTQTIIRNRPSATSGWAQETNGSSSTRNQKENGVEKGSKNETQQLKASGGQHSETSRTSLKPVSLANRAEDCEVTSSEIQGALGNYNQTSEGAISKANDVADAEGSHVIGVESELKVPAKRGRKPGPKKSPVDQGTIDSRQSKRTRARKGAESPSPSLLEQSGNNAEIDGIPSRMDITMTA
ncbi:hypothetical protein M422DRAFT_265211 [Sphaerobolus stellatus SS14]|uniref:Unplaced genomic scaffold SPHSTscaffold_145, whole genome shotgun sequence n=1 Tax=Sphaerobolus stellatus (strain SS14) TaxID=990650 RepID=A0A0C9TRT7_SPHS4|nr:hypothetical protein M422DRAFT_265211 [Sphaerobolus stellatus SS14]